MEFPRNFRVRLDLKGGLGGFTGICNDAPEDNDTIPDDPNAGLVIGVLEQDEAFDEDVEGLDEIGGLVTGSEWRPKGTASSSPPLSSEDEWSLMLIDLRTMDVLE